MACEDLAHEALEPFAKLPLGAEVYDDVDLVLYQNAGRAITVGDVRRARTAYNAIGSGVKALEKCHHCGGLGFDPVDGVSPCSWCRGSGADPDQPSTHTAAGAGPVGWTRRDLVRAADLLADRASQEERHTPECTDNIGEREKRMVVIERDDAGKPTVWCDPCIAPLVKALNDAGIRTVASCCGHSHRPGSIALADGRWLVIGRDEMEWRRIEALFPVDINGEDRSQEERIREDEREACARIADDAARDAGASADRSDARTASGTSVLAGYIFARTEAEAIAKAIRLRARLRGGAS